MELSTETDLKQFLERWHLEGLATGFVASGWSGIRLVELTAEDLADLGVPRAVRSELLAALRAAMMQHQVERLGYWMTPLALMAAACEQEQHPRLRLWAACELVEMGLRLIVIIGLAQVRESYGASLPHERLRRVFEHIRTPTLSHWRAMGLEIVGLMEEGDDNSREVAALLGPIARAFADRVGHGGNSETQSLLRLRNMLAHGSVSTAWASDLMDRWRGRIDAMLAVIEPLAVLPLLARSSESKVLRVAGEAGTVEILSGFDPDTIGSRAGAVAIRLQNRILPLAPFVLRGVPRSSDTQSNREVPQIFLRRSEVLLEYIALGAEDTAFSQSDDDYFREFEQLFEIPRTGSDRRYQTPGFEEELRRDAQHFIGRARELEALRACVTGPARRGLFWLYGPPGAGKSMLMARLAVDLIEEAEARRIRGEGEPWLVLAYRFRAGHASCRGSYFLAFLHERLSEAVADPATATAVRGLDDRQAALMLMRQATNDRRVVLVLDGLDEIVAEEPDFLSLDLAPLVGAGALWLCAGRPEGALSEFMRRYEADEPLPNGLGGMEVTAIRAMLLEKAGPLGRKLLSGDRDAGRGQEVVNDFVEAVARKAEGLPLYVRYVVGDILANRLRFLDGREAESLPPSLMAYYQELVLRCAVGDDHVIATYALCCLALAYESLSVAALGDLLLRRLPFLGNEAERESRVRSALGRLGGMVTRSLTPEGEVGFRIYHASLREHLLASPALQMVRGDVLEGIFCQGALDPSDGAAAQYLYRKGVQHLLHWQSFTGRERVDFRPARLLAQFSYQIARLSALRAFPADGGLRSDWALVLKSRQRLSNVEQDWARFWATDGVLFYTRPIKDSARQLLEIALEFSPESTIGAAVTPYLEELARVQTGESAVKTTAVIPIFMPYAASRLVELDPCQTTLQHDGIVNCVFLRDGRIASWDPEELRIWGAEGVMERVLNIGIDRQEIDNLEWPDGYGLDTIRGSTSSNDAKNVILNLSAGDSRWKFVSTDVTVNDLGLFLSDKNAGHAYLDGHLNRVAGLSRWDQETFLSFDLTGRIKVWNLQGLTAEDINRISWVRKWDDWTLLMLIVLQTDELLTICDVPRGWRYQMWSPDGQPGLRWFAEEREVPISIPDGRTVVFKNNVAVVKDAQRRVQKHAGASVHRRTRSHRPMRSTPKRHFPVLINAVNRVAAQFHWFNANWFFDNTLAIVWDSNDQAVAFVDAFEERYVLSNLSHKILFIDDRHIYCRRGCTLVLLKLDLSAVKAHINRSGQSIT